MFKHFLMFAVTVSLAAVTACATVPEQSRSDSEMEALRTRLEDAERMNGRLTVKVEELEETVFLLQDRIESHRIALQRQGLTNPGHAQAPQPTPESYWGHTPQHSQPPRRHQVTRIPLGYDAEGAATREGYHGYEPRDNWETEYSHQAAREEEEEIVIDDEALRRFVGANPEPVASRPSTSAPSATGRRAQEDVTDETLPTTRQLQASQEPASRPVQVPENASSQDLMVVYSDSLAKYRAGRYQDALHGFQTFLNAGPRADYVDNAMYWIGECHYGLGSFDTSVEWFQRVIREVPNGNKVADAMLKMSLAFHRMGENERAVSTVEELMKKYPNSNAARLGAQRVEDFR